MGNGPYDPFPIASPGVWCLLPKRASGNAIIVAVAKDSFIRACQTGEEALFDDGQLVDAVTDYFVHMAKRSRLEPYYKKRSRRYPRF